MSTVVESLNGTAGAPGTAARDAARDKARRRRPAAVALTGSPLSVEEVVDVARRGAAVSLTDETIQRMGKGRDLVERLAQETRPHYGISTGFGALHSTRIPPERRRELQRNLVLSHAAGTGAEVEDEVVRALMLCRLATLSSGRTGVRCEVAQVYAAMLNARITPIVHEYGSLGASGDLSPLAHVALAAIGQGSVHDAQGHLLRARDALTDADIRPLVLAEKEGLALINGTSGMLGMLALAIHDIARLAVTADIAAALSVEGLLGSAAPFSSEAIGIRPHPGQAASAENIRKVLDGSSIITEPRIDGASDSPRVQDAYSLRCAPQVHGAARDTLAHAHLVADHELAAVVDNPVITDDDTLASNGNFHGAPLAYVLDFLAIATADLASISERRTDRFLDPSRNSGLPAFLAQEAGVDSGMMIAQYTAAGIVSEMKRLAAPASVDSIPTSAMQEDHVSMGWAAARKLRRSVDGLGRVLAIEIVTACRAIELRDGAPAPATRAVLDLLRTAVPGRGPDRPLSPEIEAAHRLVEDGSIAAAVAAVTGPLA